MVELVGDSVIDVAVAFVTVTCALTETEPSVAVIVDCPGVSPVRIPVCQPTVATLGDEEVQFTTLVRSCAAPELRVPCALS